MDTVSVWKDTTQSVNYSSLNADIKVDVAIIGGGITGLTAAEILKKAGKRVAVLEALKIGEGSTGYSTGNLYSLVGHNGLQDIQSKFNKDTVKEVVSSRGAAIDFIEGKIREYSLQCDFERVPWCLFSQGSNEFIQKEEDAILATGLKPTYKISFPLPVKEGIRLENQAQFNPLKYVKQLAEKIQSKDCLIFENTKVENITDETPCTLKCGNYTVTADLVVMATHTPKGVYAVHSNIGPYREYAVGAKLKSGYPGPGIFWELGAKGSEHNSMRTYETPKGKILMVLGEVHKVGQKENSLECFQKLEDFLRKRFEVESIEYKWSAQNYQPADSLPYIGKTGKNSNVFIATGFAADGLVYGTLSAMIISDLINGKENKWSTIYDAQRHTPLASAKDFIRENMNVAAQYLKDIPFNVDIDNFKELKSGEGKTIEIKGEKYASYRDERDELHVVSAVCTHMKCIVNWNNSEKSWDCPCHGSRFTIDGEVIEGPAIGDLAKMKNKK